MSSLLDKYLAVTKEEGGVNPKRRIRVVVKDWDGNLVNKALVKVYRENNDNSLHFLGEGYTNSKGEIIINGLSKNKRYKLEIIYDGITESKFIEARKEIEDEYYEDYGYDDEEGEE
ncbi:MAG: hypothetical protein GX206_09510 [Clostridiales bacterium]|nr:hypothetical protein [Clostridiales bacterium]